MIVAQIKGLRSTSRHKPSCPCRASMPMATTLTSGTAVPMMIPSVATPDWPNSMLTTASPM